MTTLTPTRFLFVIAMLVVALAATASANEFVRGTVVWTSTSGCDYYVVETNLGYSVVEWYGGPQPSNGDAIIGDLHSYGFTDVYFSRRDRTGRVYVEDYMLGRSSVLEIVADKCY
jgi:hypothetical protein